MKKSLSILLVLCSNLFADQVYYIGASNVNVRSTPIVSDNIKFVLENGWQPITIIEEKKGSKSTWSKIVLTDKRSGWVVSKLVQSLNRNSPKVVQEQFSKYGSKALSDYDLKKIKQINNFYIPILKKSVKKDFKPDDILISYFVPTGKSYVWKIWNARTRETLELLRTLKRPSNINYDSIHQVVYFQEGDTVMSIDMSNYKFLNYIAKNNKITTYWGVPDIWISKDASTLYRRYGVMTKDGEFAIVEKRSISNGKWKSAQRVKTKFEGYEPLGFSVVDNSDNIQWKGRHNSYGGTYGGGGYIGDLPSFVKKSELNKFTEPNYAAISKTTGLLTSSEYGDTLHLLAPVALLQKNKKSITYIDVDRDNHSSNKALEISSIGKYLLISDEYTGDGLVVYDMNNGTKVLEVKDSLESQWLGN